MEHDNLDYKLEQLDIRAEGVRQAMMRASEEQIEQLWRSLDFSMIYHDWALEGQVVTLGEMETAFDARDIFDSSSLPMIQAIRAHKEGIELAREISKRKEIVIDLNMFRDFHVQFASDQQAASKGEYRKEIPLHRTYFHEICNPANIEKEMKALVQWFNHPDVESKDNHPIVFVSKFHLKFMKIFPFFETSGKVGRTMMNTVLMHHGYLPAVIHATERQQYYETMRNPRRTLAELLIETLDTSFEAAERFLR